MADPSRPVTGYPASNHDGNGYGYAANPPPSGTGYPYAAPAPPSDHYYNSNNAYYPQSYQPDNYSARRATLLRRIFAIVIALVVVFGAITFIVWLVLRPEHPEVRVDSSVSNLTFSNNSLVSLTSEFRLTVRNPNKKMTLSYDDIDIYFYYQSSLLAETDVSPFSQGTKTDTPLTANFVAARGFVESSAVNGINSERNKGNVVFNLRMVSRVEFEAKAWRTRRRLLKVFCGDLSVGFPSNGISGTLTGGPKKCRVGV